MPVSAFLQVLTDRVASRLALVCEQARKGGVVLSFEFWVLGFAFWVVAPSIADLDAKLKTYSPESPWLASAFQHGLP